MKVKETFLDILFPKTCLNCQKEGSYICEQCEIFLSELESTRDVWSCWEYEGLMEKLIRRIKFSGQHHIINELMEKAFQKIPDLPVKQDFWGSEFLAGAYLTFVPMARKKERKRGFNQSALIASNLGALLGQAGQEVKVLPLLEKSRDSLPQSGLSLDERLENVRGAFKPKKMLNSENVLLMDDVYSTGSTIAECKKALKEAGAKNVLGFTLARENI